MKYSHLFSKACIFVLIHVAIGVPYGNRFRLPTYFTLPVVVCFLTILVFVCFVLFYAVLPVVFLFLLRCRLSYERRPLVPPSLSSFADVEVHALHYCDASSTSPSTSLRPKGLRRSLTEALSMVYSPTMRLTHNSIMAALARLARVHH